MKKRISIAPIGLSDVLSAACQAPGVTSEA